MTPSRHRKSLAIEVDRRDTGETRLIALTQRLVDGTISVAARSGDDLTGGSRLHLLVVDAEESVRNACCQIAVNLGFVTGAAGNIDAALAILKGRHVDLVLLDQNLASTDLMSLFEEVQTHCPKASVIVMTAFATVESAVDSMREGALDYLSKPFGLDELVTSLERAANRIRGNTETLRLRERFTVLDGTGKEALSRSPEMENLYGMLSKVVQTKHPVLILGENGTGKEMVARLIHFNGPNKQLSFVPVDCDSLTPELLERELFGCVKGAFTGASRSGPLSAREGLLTKADAGTVFLDQIDRFPVDLQAKLRRALQQKKLYPVGGSHTVPMTARVLVATDQDLLQMVNQGKFRRDLYQSLTLVSLRIPPLRDRKNEIPMLVLCFLRRERLASGIAYSFSDDALLELTTYEWPGNVRELESAIQRACALSSGPVLQMSDLPTQLRESAQLRRSVGLGLVRSKAVLIEADTEAEATSIVSLAEIERRAILGTIHKLNGDKLLAAKLLKIGKTTLYRKLKEYGVDVQGG
jgi:DNA-binding NtrC family response regulator